MTKRVLVTGGTGKTGRGVVERLSKLGIKSTIATRNPKSANETRFDWADPSTSIAFEGCNAAYLVAPTDRIDHLAVMQPMLETALGAGVTRFVLLSASSIEPGGPMMGEVHAWLANHAPEWAVLRPSWFMQNLSEGQHLKPILEEGAIYSATEDGKIGFIDAADIAACAAALFAAERTENGDHILSCAEGPLSRYFGNLAAKQRKSGSALPADDALPAQLFKPQPVTRVSAFASARQGTDFDQFL